MLFSSRWQPWVLLLCQLGGTSGEAGPVAPGRCALIRQGVVRSSDLGQGQPCGLRGSDEPQPVQNRVVVGPVPVGGAGWFGEQSAAFVEPHGSRRNSDGVGHLTDQHPLTVSLLTFTRGRRFTVTAWT